MNDHSGLAMLGAEWKNTAFEDFFKSIYLYKLHMCKKCVCTYIHTHTKTPQKKFGVQRESRSFHSQKRFKAYMFGVHIGAFHGGVMRIENTEITRSGQVEGADILAGYSGPEESETESLSGTWEISMKLL